MKLNKSQTEASDAIVNWLGNSTDPLFFLNGRAGTGKTFLVSQIARELGANPVVVLAPTHKALGVLREKFHDAEITALEIKEAKHGITPGVVYLATHSSFLGISPMITEEQDEELKFGKNREGTSSHFARIPGVTVIMDEASMLSIGAHDMLLEWATARDGKVLFVGDTGQLPPVKAKPAPLADIYPNYELKEIVRQAKGSSIIDISGGIRDGQYMAELTDKAGDDFNIWEGDGGRKPFIEDFLNTIVPPTADTPEASMSVYVAYRNVVVDYVNNAACEKAYGHGSDIFEVGERVISQEGITIWNKLERREESFAHTSEPLEVKAFGEDKVPVWCSTIGEDLYANPITLRSLTTGMTFTAHYLNPGDRDAKAGLYMKELEARKDKANKLQAEYKKLRDARSNQAESVNTSRKRAWAEFFQWKDRTMAKITHPFAITSHKSQGSTYNRVFVDMRDIAATAGEDGLGAKSLYVSITRAATRVDLLV